MLVLTRRRGETTLLDFSGMTDAELLSLRTTGPVKISVTEIRSDKVRLGFEAPEAVKVHRQELAAKSNPTTRPTSAAPAGLL